MWGWNGENAFLQPEYYRICIDSTSRHFSGIKSMQHRRRLGDVVTALLLSARACTLSEEQAGQVSKCSRLLKYPHWIDLTSEEWNIEKNIPCLHDTAIHEISVLLIFIHFVLSWFIMKCGLYCALPEYSHYRGSLFIVGLNLVDRYVDMFELRYCRK